MHELNIFRYRRLLTCEFFLNFGLSQIANLVEGELVLCALPLILRAALFKESLESPQPPDHGANIELLPNLFVRLNDIEVLLALLKTAAPPLARTTEPHE